MRGNHPKFIFVVGGVISGVGKGVASSSIAKILQDRGLTVTAIKIDPYINLDAGTMNPTEHGEVFVLKVEMKQIRTWETTKDFSTSISLVQTI